MKKYLVIGNPIMHSLSPKLHNYWIKQNNLQAIYEKKLLNEDDIRTTIGDLKSDSVSGINVTVPFKKSVIPFLNELTPLAKETESVNVIYKKKDKIIGDNTDVPGFQKALEYINYRAKGKKVFILGAGGVAPSLISSLKKLGVSDIFLSNRTKKKSRSFKRKIFLFKTDKLGRNCKF